MKQDMGEIICYCFGYTRQDIMDDLATNLGRSTIMERIMAEKKAGRCRCKETNPKGR